MSSTGSRRSARSRVSRHAADSSASADMSLNGSAADLFQPPSVTAGGATTEPSGIHDSELSSPLSYGSELVPAIGHAGGPVGHGEEGAQRPLINVSISGSAADAAAGGGSESDGAALAGPGVAAPNLVIWGTDVNMERVVSRFTRFLRGFEAPADDNGEFESAARAAGAPLYLHKLDECALTGEPYLDLDCAHLLGADAVLYRQMVTYPAEVIPHFDLVAFRELQRRHPGQAADLPDAIHVRPYNCDRSRAMRALNPEDIDQLMSLRGMVIRLSSVLPEMLQAHFQCGVCGASTTAGLDRGRIPEPTLCANCHGAHTFEIVHNRCKFSDKQVVKLQEAPEDMPAGQTPQTVLLFAYADQVDKVTPGDRVQVAGIFRAIPVRPNPMQRNVKSVYKTHVDVVHFQRESGVGRSASSAEDAANGHTSSLRLSAERLAQLQRLQSAPDLYERLAGAVAPSIYENEDVKKGILLQLFGGKRKDMSEAGRDGFRAEINVLLCGDPGTSKSQLLQYVYRLMPRSQYTSGKGSSAVGLTAYVTKDPETKQMTLQTGALVLADNGVCCIDEFDKMSDAARAILHEVMEQQTLSIAKAGIICQLNARASVLAAANPMHSKWDPKQTIIENIQLPHTLLSRFDLIFLILDPQDEVFDARLARHLVTCYYKSPEEALEESLEMDLLRDYVQYAKETIQPKLSESAQLYLVEEYVEMRRMGSGRGQVSAYPRQLESLIRISEAHARMRWSSEVTEADCREARRLQKEALKQAATDPITGLIDVNILTTGVSSSLRKRRDEMADAVWTFLQERRVKAFTVTGVFQELKQRSDRLISRDLFEDGLNVLKNDNKIDWAGNTIRVR